MQILWYRSPPFWSVIAETGELHSSMTDKGLPHSAVIGAISLRGGKVHVRSSVPMRGFKDSAARAVVDALALLLRPDYTPKTTEEHDARQQLLSIEQNRNAYERAKREAEANRNGSFIVQTSDGKERRFHEMRQAQDYANDRLKKLGRGARAEFFRAPVPGATHGSKTGPIFAMEVNEHGNLQMANLNRSGGTTGPGGGGAIMSAGAPYYAENHSGWTGFSSGVGGGAARARKAGHGGGGANLVGNTGYYAARGPVAAGLDHFMPGGGGARASAHPLVGERVEIAPHYDLWMQGARYGEVRSVKNGIAHVRMDNPRVRNLARIKVQDLKLI